MYLQQITLRNKSVTNMQLQQLLNTYAVKTQHNSTAKNNYFSFNANAAYVTHMLAYKQLQQHYTHYANITNCAQARAIRCTLNSAINACNSKIAYAIRHTNFCVNTASAMLAKAKRAARNATH